MAGHSGRGSVGAWGDGLLLAVNRRWADGARSALVGGAAPINKERLPSHKPGRV